MTDDQQRAAEARAGIALDEARRAVDEQRGALESLRARTVGLLGLVGGITVLGASGLHGKRLGVAFVLLLVVVAAVVIVLLPRSFRSTVSAKILGAEPWSSVPPARFVKELAEHLDCEADANESTLGRLQIVFLVALVALVATGVLALVLLSTVARS